VTDRQSDRHVAARERKYRHCRNHWPMYSADIVTAVCSSWNATNSNPQKCLQLSWNFVLGRYPSSSHYPTCLRISECSKQQTQRITTYNAIVHVHIHYGIMVANVTFLTELFSMNDVTVNLFGVWRQLLVISFCCHNLEKWSDTFRCEE